MNTRFANIFSVVLHPLLIPTELFCLLFFLAPLSIGVDSLSFEFKVLFLAFIFIFTFFAPATIIFWLYKQRLIKDLQLTALKDRQIPYFITTTIYALLSCFLYRKDVICLPLAYILGAITLVIFMVGIISLWWQISAHAAGIAGALGCVALLLIRNQEQQLFYPTLLIICLSGLILTARLELNAHNPAQVYAGFVLGLLISISSICYFF